MSTTLAEHISRAQSEVKLADAERHARSERAKAFIKVQDRLEKFGEDRAYVDEYSAEYFITLSEVLTITIEELVSILKGWDYGHGQNPRFGEVAAYLEPMILTCWVHKPLDRSHSLPEELLHALLTEFILENTSRLDYDKPQATPVDMTDITDIACRFGRQVASITASTLTHLYPELERLIGAYAAAKSIELRLLG